MNLKQILTPLGLGLTLWGMVTIPAKANPVIIINQPSSGYPYHHYHYNYNQTPSTNYIYGSPISTPIPVNPYTGQSTMNQHNNNYYRHQVHYPYGYDNNRVIYYNNYPSSGIYYTPNNGSSFYYNSSGGFYMDLRN